MIEEVKEAVARAEAPGTAQGNRGQWRQLWQAIGVEFGMMFFFFWREPFVHPKPAKVPEPLEFGIQKVLGRDHFDAVLFVWASNPEMPCTKDGGSFPFPR